jgi:hypothetical protein
MATLTTPAWGLPYPDGAERVMDGDNAMGALATATDAALSRIATPQGVVVTGPVKVGIASGGAAVVLPLDTVSFGAAAWLDDPGDRIVIPASGVADGWFAIEAYVQLDKSAAGLVGVFTLEAGAGGSTLVLESVAATGSAVRRNFSSSARIQPGQQVRILYTPPTSGVASDCQVRRLVVRRIGAALTALGGLEE